MADSDEDNGSQCPVFYEFCEEGQSACIKSMTNIAPNQFENIWNVVEDSMTTSYNVGRGKKYSVSGRDALFMPLTVLKHGGG